MESKDSIETIEIIHDKENSQLYFEIEGSRAFVDYKLRRDRIYLIHVEVPVALRGKGMGKILIDKVLEKFLEEGYDKDHRIIAKCSFAIHVVSKSEKWKEIVEH